jgi:hypothetical protein
MDLIEFFPADASGGARLVLGFDPSLQSDMLSLFKRFTLETPPLQVIYENIDVPRTRDAISALLRTRGHVSRTSQVVLPPATRPQSIDHALGTTPPPAVLAAILDQIFKVGGAPRTR